MRASESISDEAAEDFDSPGAPHSGTGSERAVRGAATPGSDLDARYGRTAGRTRRVRLTWWLGAAAFVVVFAAWLVWAGGSPNPVDARDTAHTVLDEHAVSVSFEVSMPPGQAASCALQAMNESFAIVGWKVVEIPASTERTRAFTERVRTTELSVTGLIYRCWPVE